MVFDYRVNILNEDLITFFLTGTQVIWRLLYLYRCSFLTYTSRRKGRLQFRKPKEMKKVGIERERKEE